MNVKECNLKVTSQYSFCCNPLSMDLYSGCTHRCKYCFAYSFHKTASCRTNSAEFDFDNATICKYDKFLKKIKPGYVYNDSLVDHLIKNRQPLHIGGMADPFPLGVEEHFKHAYKFLKQVGDYPLIISTKNPMYPELIGERNVILQCSIIGFGDIFRKIEPGVLSGEERIEKLKAFKGKAKKIVIRMQPFMPWLYTEKTLEEFVSKCASVCDALTVEFLHLQGNYNKDLDKALGICAIDKIKSNGEFKGNEAHFSDEYMLKYILLIRDLCHKHGIEFYSAENSLRNYGDSINCCGLCKNNVGFESKNDRNTGRLFELGVDKIKVDDFLKTVDSKLYSRWRLGDSDNSSLNCTNARKYSISNLYTVWDDYVKKLKSNNPLNPAVLYRDIKIKNIDGELWFIINRE